MCHGMWPVGIVIGFVAVVGLAADRQVGRKALLRMLAVPALSAVAAGLTPVGPSLYGAVLLVNSRGKYFSEWAAPTFTTSNGLALLALVGLTLIILLRGGQTAWFELLLVGLAGGWAVYSSRTVPVAAAIILPVAAAALQSLIGRRTRPARAERAVVLGGLPLPSWCSPSWCHEPPPSPRPNRIGSTRP